MGTTGCCRPHGETFPYAFCYVPAIMIRIANRTFSNRADLAIDLGTANTLVVERGSGVVFDEPSICCFRGSGDQAELIAAGNEAHSLVGRVVKPLRIVRPLKHGVLSDMAAARELLEFATRAVSSSWRIRRARIVISVPADATQAERNALTTAANDVGLIAPELIAEPFLFLARQFQIFLMRSVIDNIGIRSQIRLGIDK